MVSTALLRFFNAPFTSLIALILSLKPRFFAPPNAPPDPLIPSFARPSASLSCSTRNSVTFLSNSARFIN